MMPQRASLPRHPPPPLPSSPPPPFGAVSTAIVIPSTAGWDGTTRSDTSRCADGLWGTLPRHPLGSRAR